MEHPGNNILLLLFFFTGGLFSLALENKESHWTNDSGAWGKLRKRCALLAFILNLFIIKQKRKQESAAKNTNIGLLCTSTKLEAAYKGVFSPLFSSRGGLDCAGEKKISSL